MSDADPDQLTVEELYRRLVVGGGVEPGEGDEAVQQAERVAQPNSEPWYLRAFAFVGAWISAAFAFLVIGAGAAWVGIPDELVEHWLSWVALGVALFGITQWLDERGGDSLFFTQVAAVVAGTGLGLVVGGGYRAAGEYLGDWAWVPKLALAAGCFGTAVAAYVRRRERDFYGQLALFASFFGYWIVLVAADAAYEQLFDARYHNATSRLVFVVFTPITAVLYRYYESALHRFVTTLAVPPMAVMAIMEMADARMLDEASGMGLMGLLFAIATASVVLAFYPLERLSLRTQLSLRPLGYAASVSMVWMASGFFSKFEPSGMYAVATACALIYLLWRVTETTETWRHEPIVFGVGAIVLLAMFSTPGILVGLLFLALGLWRQQGRFLGFGIVTLGCYLVEFYYSMEISLFDKSLMLMATGAVLLAVRLWCVRRTWFGGRALS